MPGQSDDAAVIGKSLRRISELIDRDAARVYQALGVHFEQRWLGVLGQLAQGKPLSVSQLADVLRITHASVSETRKSLESAKLIKAMRDKADGRQRLLSLTAAGVVFVDEMAPVWQALEAASIELNAEARNVAAALNRLDVALQKKSLYDRVMEQLE